MENTFIDNLARLLTGNVDDDTPVWGASVKWKRSFPRMVLWGVEYHLQASPPFEDLGGGTRQYHGGLTMRFTHKGKPEYTADVLVKREKLGHPEDDPELAYFNKASLVTFFRDEGIDPEKYGLPDCQDILRALPPRWVKDYPEMAKAIGHTLPATTDKENPK